jgi:3,4-dihydroxy-2-butanone 4-phosphate synthase
MDLNSIPRQSIVLRLRRARRRAAGSIMRLATTRKMGRTDLTARKILCDNNDDRRVQVAAAATATGVSHGDRHVTEVRGRKARGRQPEVDPDRDRHGDPGRVSVLPRQRPPAAAARRRRRART